MKYLLFLASILILSCTSSDKKEAVDPAGRQVTLDFATGFRIFELENGIFRITINRPYHNSTDSLQYLLVPRGIEVPAHSDDETVIRTPVESIVCTSTTHIPLLDYLGETEALVGFPTPDYISSEKMRRRIDSGGVVDLGVDKSLNIEMILELNPDMVMTYSVNGNDPVTKRLKALGVPVLINGEYLEDHPLGRAEWIKVAGLLFGKTDRSDSVFNEIKSRYINLAESVKSVDFQPSAFSGVMYGDTWFLPGGNNYAARLMKDAAINYLWSKDTSTGFLELSFESVLEQASNAELWLGVASFTSLRELSQEDSRYALFRAYREGNVYTYDARKGAKGGSEYLELGYLRPDLILSDLIEIAHPEVTKTDSLYFYAKLLP